MRIMNCGLCGEPFLPKRESGKPQKYCSARCRERAKSRNRNRRAAAAGRLEADNERLRRTMGRQEETIQMHQDASVRAARQDRGLTLLARAAADDLSILLEAGVLTLDRSHPRAGLLHRHSRWIRLMEEYSGREQDLVAEQRQLIADTRSRLRKQYDQALREGRDRTYMEALKHRQAEELREVNRKCPQYWAWYELQDRRDGYRQDHHSEMGSDAPELGPLLHTLRHPDQEAGDPAKGTSDGRQRRRPEDPAA